jgi:hypothetical protein
VDGVTYICGQDVREIKLNKEPTIIKKTYFCVMVRDKSGNADNVWISIPGCRSAVNMEYEKRKGKVHGYFEKNDYWLDSQEPHVCRPKYGASVRDIDQCPPLTMIMTVG